MKTLRTLIFITFILSSFLSANAQISITGQLIDTTQEKVMAATVMLLNAKDSALVNYTTSNKDGYFFFNNIKRNNYILKVSHVTYMPISISINPKENEKNINLGVIEMREIANFLMEVVLKEAKAPIFIKGDTVEYDATTFKVPPGSTVEDLLKKLPGIEVDANGAISTMGRDVNSVYVDGKVFFSNDPKTVTQNLDAAAVKKVQVYTEKSEQEKITGLSDGSKDKALNLELKDEYKKGYFGKATAGGGIGFIENTKIRPLWIGSGNFNWFSDKHQLSFIANTNNLNQGGYNWSDYMEFKGQSMSFGNDNGDFGFNSNYSDFRPFRPFRNNESNSGFSKNTSAGVNYNFTNKKVKYNLGYYYSRNNTESDTYKKMQTFLPDTNFYNFDTITNQNIRNNHNIETRLEYLPDSSNTFIARASINLSDYNTNDFTKQMFLNSEEIKINTNSIDNSNNNDILDLSTLLLYYHKFKKKGRRFGVSASYNLENDNTIEDVNNINEFFVTGGSESDLMKLLIKTTKDIRDEFAKSSLIYTEPIGKRFTFLGFYNFKYDISTQNNISLDKEQNNIKIDSLNLAYQAKTLYNRLGASLDYNYNGIDIIAGVAFQSLKLSGSSETSSVYKSKPLYYNNFVPYFRFLGELPNDFYIDIDYSYNIDAPEIHYLFPVPNLTNRLSQTFGNTDLIPERYHSIQGHFSWWNQANMVSISLSPYANFYENQIIYNQEINFVDSIGYVTSYRPDNVKGGNGTGINLWTNFPIVKTVLSMSISAGYNYSNSPIFINTIENITNSNTVSSRLSFNLNVGEKLSFNFSGGANFTDSKYSIQTTNNQQTINYSLQANAKWQFLRKSFLEITYAFSNYNNSRFDYNQNINRLNASIRQVIGKKNQWELRLSAMDILNQTQYIYQYIGSNYLQYTESPTLARYFLLTVAYNLRGFNLDNNRHRPF